MIKEIEKYRKRGFTEMNFADVFMKLYPMKAKGIELKKIPWEDSNYIWQRKYDGDRRLLWCTEEGNFNTSRNLSKETGLPTDKSALVPHITYFPTGLKQTILDGEFDHVLGMDKGVRRIMGCLPDEAIKRQEEIGKIYFWVYDILCYEGEWLINKTLEERQFFLNKVFIENLNGNSETFRFVPSFPGGDKEYLEKKLEEIYGLPFGEGMVGKSLKSKYVVSLDKCKVCPKTDWIKLKKGYEGDFVIMGYEDPTFEYTGDHLDTHQYWYTQDSNNIPVTKYYHMGWIGAIIYGDYQNGKLTRVGTVSSGLTEQMRQEITVNQNEYLGKVIKIKAFERVTDSRSLKQPRFIEVRDDKEPEDCIYENQKG